MQTITAGLDIRTSNYNTLIHTGIKYDVLINITKRRLTIILVYYTNALCREEKGCNNIIISIYLSIYLSIYVHPFVHPSIHTTIHPSVRLSVRPSFHPSIHPSVCLYIYLSIYLSTYLSIYTHHMTAKYFFQDFTTYAFL